MSEANKRNYLVGSAVGLCTFVGYHLWKQLYSTKGIGLENFQIILTASAPGKIILTGEHAVVHGIEALATAIDKRAEMKLYQEKNGIVNDNKRIILDLGSICLDWDLSRVKKFFKIHMKEWSIDILMQFIDDSNTVLTQPKIINVENVEQFDKWLKNIYKVFWLLLFNIFDENIDLLKHSIYLSLNSQIPIGAGLGSSAAWSTVLCCVFYKYFQFLSLSRKEKEIDKAKLSVLTKTDKERIYNLSFQSEKINHGTPSGIDNSVVLYGGYIRFKKEEKSNIISNEMIERNIKLLVINSNAIGNTKKLVSRVSKLYKNESNIVKPIFESMEQIGKELMDIIKDDQKSNDNVLDNMKQLFDLNHGLLCAIGVGHSNISFIDSIVKSNKVRGLKITGAGGGGCVIVAVNDHVDNVDKLQKQLLSHGYSSFVTSTGQSGLYCVIK